MITRANNIPTQTKPTLLGGKGEAHFSHLGSIEQLCGTGRLFSIITLQPDCSIGEHRHVNEFEFYYVMSGGGLYNDNGSLSPIATGDITYCPNGEIHGIENYTSEPLVLLALVGFPKEL